MDEHKPQKRSILYYYTIIIIVVMFLNALIFPSLMDKKMVEIDYGKFLTMLDTGKVKSVEIESNKIAISPSSSKDKNIYITGRMDDPELVDRLKDAKVEFTKIIPKENSPLLSILLTWIVPIGILMLFGNLMMKSMQKRMGGNSMQFGKSNAKMYVSAQSGKRFNDVAGQDEAKEALSEIVDFLHNPEKYKKIGAQMPKGALLVGPPGTGKTLLAKAVAGEADVPFFSISGSEFVEMFVGMGASRIRDLFKQAKEKAPCIVFIDEIDTIGKKRDNGSGLGGNDEREQTLNQLLSEMDGFDGGIGVVILAATNRPDSLDKALLRPGRFDRRIPVELPDLGGREAILKVHAKNVNVDSNIDYNAIARSTSGASGAELANIVNEAALLAVKSGRDVVEQQDFEESVETVIAGYQRKGAVISDKEKKIIAYHEIGHALVAAMQKHSAPVHKITIIPRTSGALGYTMQVAEDESVLMSKEEAIDKITTFTGGRAAEEVIFNTCTSGASNDIEQATKIARAMVTRLGMSEEFDMVALETVSNQYLGGDSSLACSSDTAAKIDEEVFRIVKTCHKNAIEILENNIDKLHELAEYLLEKETITGDEFMEILNLK
ncbi:MULTISPECIES: ATP-dependent zinc metalloprotease FtsH [Clostridioides]|uniref:ATP-dependent zinc metalloprotease FtsH n=1 Tax=unclassified Clostridioides TaxID=2635829 RepID=UPI001D10AD8C|nr:ATP-dependent zinc metalloprotease FtsH [Clostridioides sp. ZZV15-6388]MCC0643182.1 ATP-dependent zinc metalloprotease FtsH [Clostridioides sp. ZZV14-6150]MCC0658987.1 ATP-dependent zinc metalloprotease FtsH [Clostridioides sp. ZZV14-6154]MCC0665266.1 ATP-dependent zinc metalloprotease FtsH [Clostridioides sp. ZZV15-6597]MCC0667849.1 ATP-dependent zinc metalloprotease FtsH [Clostridioides sp. ZZV14-6153]MCC0720086.1 ATP-dependent zinc metalloprotease FtsH [Clostridioides sp. ZZV14-6105]MCC